MDLSPSNSKILVVDDNADNRALAKATLDDEGYAVITASNGEEALRAFQAESPDCVLLDVRMPGKDGFAVCEEIRRLPGGPGTPIVFLTSLRDVETFDHALRAGADDFMTKPIRPAELLVRIQTALKLRRMSEGLRELYELVRRQRDDLMRLQLQKERLSSFVVHDLKNPVSTMDLHAQLLLRSRELPERARDSAQRIRDEARSLLRMLLNLLDISKSEEGQLVAQRAEVDLESLSSELFDAIGLKAKTAEVTLERNVGARSVNADPDLLRRVLENLIDNAIRHAPKKSAVSLTITTTPGAVEIRVADAGAGVPAEMRERVFDRFVQLDSGDRAVSRGGRGLGLAFCRLAVEAHGGQIAIEDGAPGSVFYVRLPND